MKNSVYLSIIVPVYNVEKYIEQCIESIINQKEIDFELILVNDGSTDRSLDICKEYKKRNDRIKIINQKNQGVSSARNNGVKLAKGKYIMFVDSDDYLYKDDCLKTIQKNIENKDYDIVMFNMLYMYENNGEKKYDYLALFPKIHNEKIFESLIESNKLSISPCDKWIKKEFLELNNIFFEYGRKNLEDADWSLNLYLNTNNIKCINEYIYVYRKQRDGSATTKQDSKIINQQISFIEKWVTRGNKCLSNKQIKQYLSYQYMIVIGMIQKYELYSDYKDFVKKYKFLLSLGTNKKTRIALLFSKLFGIRITMILLEKYLRIREKGRRII